jgi:xylulokinase
MTPPEDDAVPDNSAAATFLGLDLGTSSLKAVIVDTSGAVVAEAKENYPTARPETGWSEQDPADWRAALHRAVVVLKRESPAAVAGLQAVGLCSAAHLPVLLDAKGAVIRPAILWNDQRSVGEARDLDREAGDLIRAETLNAPSCTWTLPQLIWVARNEPANIARAAMLLSSKDYLAYLMTGEATMDATSAAATLIYDVAAGRWSPALMARSGLPETAFPRVVSSTTIVGQTGGGAESFGLPEGLPVVSGGLDTAAEMVACGITGPADGAVIRVGSAAAVLAVAPKRFAPGVLNYPLPMGEGHYWQAGTNSGAIALQWIADIGRMAVDGETDFAGIDRLVAGTEARADAILFHPYLLGERAPYWNPDMRASFSGISGNHSWPDFLRAVMEGVAFSLRDCLAAMAAHGLAIERMKLVGGPTRSPVWTQILADILQHDLEIVEHAESSKGAAILASYGVGQGMTATRPARIVHADRGKAELYAGLFERYQALAGFIDASTHQAFTA